MPRKTGAIKKSENSEKSSLTVLVAVVLVVGVVATVGSVMWGRSDTGQIDVSATIQNSQNEGEQDENTPPAAPPPNELSEMPNGGLVPQSGESVPPPTPPPTPNPAASSTASTSPEAGDLTPAAAIPEENGGNTVMPEGEETISVTP
jgi:hypothetical protein